MSKMFLVLGSKLAYASIRNNMNQYLAWSKKRINGFSGNIITDKQAFKDSIQEIIKDMESKSKLTVKDVVISFYGSYIEMYHDSITVDLNPNKPINQHILDKVEENYKNLLIKNEQYLLYFKMLKFNLDSREIKNPLGLQGKALVVNSILFLADKHTVNNLFSIFKELYINLVDIKLLPLLQAETLCSVDEKRMGVTVIDFGYKTTNIISYYDEQPVICNVIDVGSDSITQILAQKLNISYKEAERVKCIYASAYTNEEDSYEWLELTMLSGRNVCLNKMQIVEIVEEIINQWLDCIKQLMLKSQCYNYISERFLLIGGGSKLDRLNSAIGSMFNAEVKMLDKSNKVFAKIKHEGKDVSWHNLYSLISQDKILDEYQGVYRKIKNNLLKWMKKQDNSWIGKFLPS